MNRYLNHRRPFRESLKLFTPTRWSNDFKFEMLKRSAIFPVRVAQESK